jgi:chromosome segregation ATPase
VKLQELKSKIDEVRDKKSRIDERMSLLMSQKKELEVKMEKLGVKTIEDINKKESELKGELESLVVKLESLESNILLDKLDSEEKEEEKKIIDDLVDNDDVLKGLI